MQRIRLSNNLKIRKELFGCIVANLHTKEIKFYNADAYKLFKVLVIPSDFENVLSLFEEGDRITAFDFINKLQNDGIVESTSESSQSISKFYFGDIEKFPKSYLFMPVGAEIEITLRCSRNCTYCCYESDPFVETNFELTINQWALVFDKLVESGVFSLKFTGGDPLTRKDIMDILKIADDKGIIFTLGTDLTLLNQKHIDSLLNFKHLLMVQTTLDGSYEKLADSQRGKGNFKKVLGGIELMSKNNIPFSVVTVVHKENFADIKNIAKLISPFSPLGYAIGPLFPSGRAKGTNNIIPDEQDLRIANRLFKESVDEKIISSINPACDYFTERYTEREIDNYRNTQVDTIHSPDEQLRINATGNCYVSIKLKDILDESDFFVGNIMSESISDIWHSQKLNDLRNRATLKNHFGRYFMKKIKIVK